MTPRDRIVLMVIAVVVVLGAVWLKVVSPERKHAARLTSEVSAANAQLAGVEGQLASARTAQSKYASAYASIVELGKAVPPQAEVPALVFQLGAISHVHNVSFRSVSTSSSASGSPSSGSSASSSSTASTNTPSSFTQLPFTFGFEGGFHQLASLLESIEGFTKGTQSGTLDITGRLLTIESLKLAPGPGSESKATSTLSGTVTASAYVLPPTAAGPGSGSAAGSATPTSSSSSTPSSPTTPAVAKVTP
jgi:peptidoglycan DL-endopeptidase CwlO